MSATEKAEQADRRRVFADLTPLRTSAHYRRLWFGNTVSWVGQGMTALAVSLQVYEITRSPFSVGLVGLFSLVPLIVFGLYGGAIADTVDRRKLGLASATGSAVLSAALATAAFAGFHRVWFLYAIVALQSVCAALNSPARTSMIPRLLPAEQLRAANALNSMTMTFGTLVGPSLGGLIVGVGGFQTAYLIDAFAFSAALYAMWRLPSMLPERTGDRTGTTKRASVLDGLRFLATRPNLRMTFFSDFCAMILAHPVRCSPSSPSSGTTATPPPPASSPPPPPPGRSSAGCSAAGRDASGTTGRRSCSPSPAGAPPSPSSGSPASSGSGSSSSPSPTTPTPSP